MCATCDNPSSTNPNLCGAAAVAVAERMWRIVDYKRNGKSFPWIAETEGLGIATVHKWFKRGIAEMAPPGAQEELAVIALQLEQVYSDIMDDLDATTDPGEKSKLYNAAIANIKERRALYGGEKLTITHNVQTKFDAEMEELHASFDEDQDIRNRTRERRRGGARP